jgi:uncharacterized protein (DUF302 family)
MLNHASHYGFSAVVPLPYSDVVERVRGALASEGFGIISEIDMAAALRQKLGVEVRPYVILGACMPGLAHRALLAEPDVGLLLPCNVVVYATEDADRTMVAALDPEVMLGLTRNPRLEPLAAEVTARLKRALEAVRTDAATARPQAVLFEQVEEIC